MESASTKIRNFVGQQSAKSIPNANEAKQIPDHLFFEHIHTPPLPAVIIIRRESIIVNFWSANV